MKPKRIPDKPKAKARPMTNAEVIKRAQARKGGASHEAVLEAIRHGRDRD